MPILKNNLPLIGIHLLFWLLLASFPFYYNTHWFGWQIGFIRTIIPFFFLVSLAYLNALVLIPYLFRRHRFVWYRPLIAYLSLVPLGMLLFEQVFIWLNDLTAINVYVVIQATQDGEKVGLWDSPEEATAQFPRTIIGMMVLFDLFVSSLYGLAAEFTRRERQETMLKAINLKNELKLLRSQINPHFLFNALNNLYAIVQLKPKKAGEFVLKLSDMLRYITYDCQKEKVTIQKEVVYLRNYIYFQQWREKELLTIELNIDDKILGLSIEPMLLMPFVENAFKHSYEDNKKRWINIQLYRAQNDLVFEVKNSHSEADTQRENEDEYAGIGIDNIQKRLELLYPERYDLAISNNKQHFHILLKLQDVYKN